MHYSMLSLVQGSKRANEWPSKQEVQRMSELLDLPITSMLDDQLNRR